MGLIEDMEEHKMEARTMLACLKRKCIFWDSTIHDCLVQGQLCIRSLKLIDMFHPRSHTGKRKAMPPTKTKKITLPATFTLTTELLQDIITHHHEAWTKSKKESQSKHDKIQESIKEERFYTSFGLGPAPINCSVCETKLLITVIMKIMGI